MVQRTQGMDEILRRWRDIVKDKKRQIITPEETAAMKVASLSAHIYVDREPIPGWRLRRFHYTRQGERVFLDASWRDIAVGERWGGPDVSAFFEARGVLPGRYQGKKVVLQVYFSGDGLLRVNGQAYHGLDPFRNTVPLTECAKGGEVYALEAESYIFWHAGESEEKQFECAHFAVVDEEIQAAYWDLQCAVKAAAAEGLDARVRGYVFSELERAVSHIDQNETCPARVRANALAAQAAVRAGIYDSGVFRQPGLLHLNGNSHLDVCFMWTHAEFIRKIGRTHATQLRLMEQYPEYKFSQSQPLMYEEMKRHYPDLFEQVKRRVAEGRWEALGAFYVEPDANLISGESFVRQILLGVRFMEREFGVRPRTAWIPDVFGNSWAMPQILVKSGLRYFVTHKMILWNDTNPWETHVFWWEGPDGSRIFATVPPTGFIGTMEPDHMAEHWDKYSSKWTVGESLYNYGWGDGGGGPDIEMLESARRYADFPGMPAARPATNEEALESMRQKAVEAGSAIPVVNDELYLEEHRGTYTTKGIFKKLNRTCEFLYRKAEIFSCLARAPYPAEALREGWKTVLLNQFHDSLPGSHVTKVHEDLLESYEAPLRIGRDVLRKALEGIAMRADTRGEGAPLVIFNAQAFSRNAVVRIPPGDAPMEAFGPDGAGAPCQRLEAWEGGDACQVFVARGVPGAGYLLVHLRRGSEGNTPSAPLHAAPDLLENNHVRVGLNGLGEIVELVDKETGINSIAPAGRGNVLALFEDEPGRHEAWDIVSTYRNTPFPLQEEAELRVVESGPVRAAVEVRRPFRDSLWVQRIVLYAHAKTVCFETYVNWHEQKKLLKVEFHTSIRNRHATYDIAYANIERPTTENNSHERARFETPAHMWMDLSQADHGLSLLNDCKYGHECRGGMMALTLLKGPTFPDPVADQGPHRFTYALLPHAGGWREARTHEAALCLNDPVDAIPVEPAPGPWPACKQLLRLEGKGVFLEAVKEAEEGGALIVRVVERHGGNAHATLRLEGGWTHIARCGLLEENAEAAGAAGESLRFSLAPYEIQTFKIIPKDPMDDSAEGRAQAS